MITVSWTTLIFIWFALQLVVAPAYWLLVRWIGSSIIKLDQEVAEKTIDIIDEVITLSEDMERQNPQAAEMIELKRVDMLSAKSGLEKTLKRIYFAKGFYRIRDN